MILREMLVDDLDQVMEIEQDLFHVPWTKEGFFTFLTRDDAMFLVVEEKEKKCFVCDYINHSFTNYINTIYYLYEKEEDFRKQFAASKGFCVNHYKVLFSGAPEYMGKKYLNEFLMTLNETFINGYERVRDDLEWFICKNDYRYKEQPWKNARDALQRGLVKAGSIMEAEEKKE